MEDVIDMSSYRAKYKQSREEIRGNQCSFPASSTLAEYHAWSQTIQMNKLVADDFVQKLRSGNPSQLRADLQLIAHELTHWSDHVSTLWGREYLKQIYDALNLAENWRSGQETEFWRLLALKDTDRRTNLPAYYRTVNPKAGHADFTEPWGIQYSCGYEFNLQGHLDKDRPIFFVRFTDHHTRQDVARQPLTIGTLLEATAMWSEMLLGYECVQAMKPDEAFVEASLVSREWNARIYDPSLTEYTAATHIICTTSKGKQDAFRGFEMAAILAHLVLNLPAECFDPIPHPPELLKSFGDAPIKLIQNRNRGYAFAALAHLAPTRESGQSAREWLDTTLRLAGLPDRESILRQAELEISSPPLLEVSGPYAEHFQSTLHIGKTLFTDRCDERNVGLHMERLMDSQSEYPAIFDANGTLFHHTGRRITERELDALVKYNASWKINGQLANFVPACR